MGIEAQDGHVLPADIITTDNENTDPLEWSDQKLRKDIIARIFIYEGQYRGNKEDEVYLLDEETKDNLVDFIIEMWRPRRIKELLSLAKEADPKPDQPEDLQPRTTHPNEAPEKTFSQTIQDDYDTQFTLPPGGRVPTQREAVNSQKPRVTGRLAPLRLKDAPYLAHDYASRIIKHYVSWRPIEQKPPSTYGTYL